MLREIPTNDNLILFSPIIHGFPSMHAFTASPTKAKQAGSGQILPYCKNPHCNAQRDSHKWQSHPVHSNNPWLSKHAFTASPTKAKQRGSGQILPYCRESSLQCSERFPQMTISSCSVQQTNHSSDKLQLSRISQIVSAKLIVVIVLVHGMMRD